MKKHYKGLAIAISAAMMAGGSFTALAGPASDTTVTTNQTNSDENAQGPGAADGQYVPPANQNSGQQNSGQTAEGGQQVPENTSTHVSVDYQYTSSGQVTTFSMNLNNFNGIGGVSYRAYTNAGGFLWWYHDGGSTGVPGEGSYVEAVQLQLTGDAEKAYDIYYSVTSSKQGKMGYAVNGQIAGTTNIGEYITDIEVVLVPKGGAAPSNNAMRYISELTGRLNLKENGTTLLNEDGTGANGWVDNDWARYYFINGVAVTGWQYIDGYKFYFDSYGRLVQDVDTLIGKQSSYLLKVNKTLNCLTVYAKDGDLGYIIPVKAMLTSVGDDTPIGTFKTPEKYRWRLMVNDTYTQYATRITQGFLLHSITYDVPDINHLMTVGYNGLGVTRSLGCVRLTCGNSKWIYDNCALGTSVQIYEDPNVPSPFFKPELIPLSFEQTWDPSDPLIER